MSFNITSCETAKMFMVDCLDAGVESVYEWEGKVSKGTTLSKSFCIVFFISTLSISTIRLIQILANKDP